MQSWLNLQLSINKLSIPVRKLSLIIFNVLLVMRHSYSRRHIENTYELKTRKAEKSETKNLQL